MQNINNPTFEFTCSVLEYDRNDYVDKKTGEPKTYPRALLRLDLKVFRVPVSKDLDLTSMVGKDIDGVFELTCWGDDLTPQIRLIKYS